MYKTREVRERGGAWWFVRIRQLGLAADTRDVLIIRQKEEHSKTTDKTYLILDFSLVLLAVERVKGV